MASKNSKQMIAGKSFEYSILTQFEEKLKSKTNVEVVRNNSYTIAEDCFKYLAPTQQSEYQLSSSFAVNLLMDVEPRLSNDIGKEDVLQLEIVQDSKGEDGDVRDILAIRLLQKWEIGVSAKHNHKAVKHSRLSANIDFGHKWLGIGVSDRYFEEVRPVFFKLEEIKKQSNGKKKWSEIGDYHESVYLPILKAFVAELRRLYKSDNSKVASNLISYLVGKSDFYKVIKNKKNVEIHSYNLNGSLNLPFRNILPKYVSPRVPLPTQILSIDFKKNSKNTVIVEMDNDWVLSFRIHNASSKVEASLKFDINLLRSPKNLFKNTLNIIHTK
jgi:hypothetical protein